LALDRSLTNHLAHALFFDEELDRVRAESPQRYSVLAARIRPLVGVQITEMARKLVRNRRDLHDLRRHHKSSDGGQPVQASE
jgi:hypothetical protein